MLYLLSFTTKYCQVALRSDDVSQGFIIGQYSRYYKLCNYVRMYVQYALCGYMYMESS